MRTQDGSGTTRRGLVGHLMTGGVDHDGHVTERLSPIPFSSWGGDRQGLFFFPEVGAEISTLGHVTCQVAHMDLGRSPPSSGRDEFANFYFSGSIDCG